MLAVVYGAFGVGQASSFAPDYNEAKRAANRIFALLDSQPDIDGLSDSGLKPVSYYITVYNLKHLFS